MNEPKIKQIDLESIRTDGDCQGRVSLDPGAVKEYAELAKSGTRLPPLTVFYDGAEYWLADGFHRIQAYRRNKTLRVNATIMTGDRTDARLYAAGANATHGLRRSNADKRKAVELCLDALIEKGEEWSESQVAKHCGVSKPTVAEVRADRGERDRTPSRKRQDAASKASKFDGQNPPSDQETPFLQESDRDAILDETAESGWVVADDDDVQAPERFPDTPGQKAVKDDDAKRKAEKSAPVDADSHMPAEPPKRKNGREVYNAREMKKAYAAWGVVNRALHAIGRASELETERNAIEAAFREAQERA